MLLIKSIERISELAGVVSACLVSPLVGVLVYEVFSRYALGAPTSWAFEVSYMLMGSIFILALSYALKERQHVCVDILSTALSPRSRAAIGLVGYLVFFPAVCWLTYALAQHAVRAHASGEVSGVSAWNPLVWPFICVWFVGFLLLALQSLAEILKCAQTFMGRPESQYDR
jgi:TRAP-type mannitol/chloroaromatic compound transport system permease small subunit